MNEEKRFVSKDGTSFQIKDFMFKLNITKSERLVFALIYSFTVGERGLFFGRMSYIAETLSISPRTVTRAISNLLSLELIERVALESPRAYRAKLNAERTIKAISEYKRKKPEPAPYCNRYDDALPTLDDIWELLPKGNKKYRLMDLGDCCSVQLTVKQYLKLAEIVDNEILQSYVRRLEKYLMECFDNCTPGPRNHYKTIKSWIEKDLDC